MKQREKIGQAKFIKNLKAIFADSLFVPNNPPPRQGMQDYIIYFPNGRAVFLEFKDYMGAPFEPNQQWYLDWFAQAGYYSKCVYPENFEETRLELISLHNLPWRPLY